MDIKKGIEDMKSMRQTHVNWAKYFEDNPEIEKKYVATGEWDNAKKHRELISQYDNVIEILETYATQ